MLFTLTYNNNDYSYNLSNPEWCSNNMPCMFQSKSCEIIKDKNIENNLNLINLPNEIKDFYKEIGTTLQEIYIDVWSFLSLQNIIKMLQNYKKDNIETIDFAYKYLGMGSVKVAFYDIRYEKIFYRNDGGSNEHVRQDNYKNLLNFNNSTDLKMYKKKGIDFNSFLLEISRKKFETAILF